MRIVALGNPSNGPAAALVTQALVSRHGYLVVGLEDPLKRLVRRVFGMSIAQLWGAEGDEADLRYGALPWERSSSWIGAWSALENYAPRWLADLDLDAGRIPRVRRWFQRHMFEAAGYQPFMAATPRPRAPSPRYLVETLRREMRNLTLYSSNAEPGGPLPDAGCDLVTHALRVITRIESGSRGYLSSAGIYESSVVVPAGIVIPDVRDPDELPKLKAAGAILVKVTESENDDLAWPKETLWDAGIAHAGGAHLEWLVDNLATYWAIGKLAESAGDPPAKSA